MFVKICGLSTEEHVSAAVDAGADAIGFVFAKSPRQVTPSQATSLSKSVPVTVLKVAVMLHPSNEEWLAVLQEFKPDVLQTDAGDFGSLEIPENIDTWAVNREENTVTGNQLNAAINTVTGTYLFEGARSGRGETVDWVAARLVAENGSMILAGGLDPDNVATAIAAVQPFGVDVSSGVEVAPGQKDSEKIKAFIKAAKAAGNNL